MILTSQQNWMNTQIKYVQANKPFRGNSFYQMDTDRLRSYYLYACGFLNPYISGYVEGFAPSDLPVTNRYRVDPENEFLNVIESIKNKKQFFLYSIERNIKMRQDHPDTIALVITALVRN